MGHGPQRLPSFPPHAAVYPEASVLNLQRPAAEQVRAFLSGGTPEHIVNPGYARHTPALECGIE